jgi:hypothetical protein
LVKLEPLVLQALKATLVLMELQVRQAQVSPVQQVSKALLVLQELPAPLALLVLLELALQVLQAFKDHLALLALARLATMTWGLSISKTTPPPQPLPPSMHAP